MVANGLTQTVPEGFAAVAVLLGQDDAPLRVCVLCRLNPTPGQSRYVVLRELLDAKVLLGCVVDARQLVQRWVEVWLQDIDGLAESVAVAREPVTNLDLDARWASYCELLGRADGGGLLATGWEFEHSTPLVLDHERLVPRPVLDAASGRPWQLCQDDDALRAAGLPLYSASLHRYLWLPDETPSHRFIPVTLEAPRSAATVKLADVLPPELGWSPLNLGGGLLLVRPYAPLTYKDFLQLLGGAPCTMPTPGGERLPLWAEDSELAQAAYLGEALRPVFYLALHGQAACLVESFYLRLALFIRAMRAVRALVARSQRPLLSLRDTSFVVQLGPPAPGLPLAWTAAPVLVDPGEAVVTAYTYEGFDYYLQVGRSGLSVYRPPAGGESVQGLADIRLRRLVTDRDGRVALECTLETQEAVVVGRNDLVWVRLPLQGQRLDLFGSFEETKGAAYGEYRFRTFLERLAPEVRKALEKYEGVHFPTTTFNVIPMLSTPCDLYSLAVLGMQSLLVNPGTTLAIAVDTMRSLARRLAAMSREAGGLASMPGAIAELAAADPDLLLQLGPHRLVQETLDPKTALEWLPAELWWETLAVLVRMLPGVGPDSYCRHLGDAPAGAMQAVFDRPLQELEAILRRAHSLFVVDWRYNREVNDVIAALRPHGGLR